MQPQFASSTTRSSEPGANSTTLRGLLRGLYPLLWVAGVVAVVLVLELLVSHATAGQDFFAQQRASLIVLIAGMLAAVATYIIACRAAVRQLVQWQREGALAATRGAVVGLVITAMGILLPVLLAVFLPQHPAP